MTDPVRKQLFWKIAIYYGVCFALAIVVGLTNPELMNYLPFGGIDAIQDDLTFSSEAELMGQLLANNRPLSLFGDAVNLISALTGAIVVMIPIRWVYMSDAIKIARSSEVASSLLVLPLVVTAIIYIVKFSIPLAFALAGIFAGVRYRSNLKSQSDTFFIFACIAVGLAAGTRSLGVALVLGTFFAFTLLATPPEQDEAPKESDLYADDEF